MGVQTRVQVKAGTKAGRRVKTPAIMQEEEEEDSFMWI
jgi:hypothetical protein